MTIFLLFVAAILSLAPAQRRATSPSAASAYCTSHVRVDARPRSFKRLSATWGAR